MWRRKRKAALPGWGILQAVCVRALKSSRDRRAGGKRCIGLKRGLGSRPMGMHVSTELVLKHREHYLGRVLPEWIVDVLEVWLM